MPPDDAPDLQQLFYVSRCLASPPQLEHILIGARRQNEQRGVTGVLLFTGGHFAQYFEGSPEAVARTLADIERDPRHEAMRVLVRSPIGQRRCARWWMACLEQPGADDLVATLVSGAEAPPERVERLVARLIAAAGVPPLAGTPQPTVSGALNS